MHLSAARVYASNNTLTGSANGLLAWGAYGGANLFLWENTSEDGASAQAYGRTCGNANDGSAR